MMGEEVIEPGTVLKFDSIESCSVLSRNVMIK